MQLARPRTPEDTMRANRHSPRAALRFIPATAAILALLGACSDGGPTDPVAEGGLGPVAASFNRDAPTFSFASIDVPGARATQPQGINAGGDISGLYVDASQHSHGFILHDGAFTQVDYPGADNTTLRGIGPDGTVLGTYRNDTEEAVASHGFERAPDGSFAVIHYPGHLNEIPQRILPDGTILGCRHDHDTMGSMDGMMISREGASEIGKFASMNNGATPNGRLITGFYTNMSGQATSYTIDDGVFTEFMVPGSTQTIAWDVDPRGDIVGVYRNAAGFHGFVRTASGYTTIDVPGASATRVFGTNARGDLVGAYVAGGVTHGFLMTRQ
jgi:hypothetical protein